MKLSEFRKLIREEISKVLSEASAAEKNAEKLKYNEKRVKSYKVGTGSRHGMPVDVNTLKSVLTGNPKLTIEKLENSGIVFKTAYVEIRPQSKSYLGTGSGMTMTYSLFGTDASGNEIIYDKYEGQTAGGGQSYVFVNGKKQLASAYLSIGAKELVDKLSAFITPYKFRLINFKGDYLFADTIKGNNDVDFDIPFSVMKKMALNLKKNSSKIKQLVNKLAPSITELYVELDFYNEKNSEGTLAISSEKSDSSVTKYEKIF
jgi:hypothetical protein